MMEEHNWAENLMSILPVDCLLQICKYLPIFDKFCLLEAFPFLYNDLDLIFQEHKSVNMDSWYGYKLVSSTLELEDVEKMFQMLQKHVKSLDINGKKVLGIHFLTYASKYLDNLQRLYLFNFDHPTEDLEEFKSVKELQMINCKLVPDFLAKFPNVTDINLRTTVTDKSLTTLSKLETIDIEIHPKFIIEELTSCVNNNRQLKHLTVELSPWYYSEYDSYCAFERSFTSLEFLTYLEIYSLPYCDAEQMLQYVPVHTIKSLKHLIIRVCILPRNVYILLRDNKLESLQIGETEKIFQPDIFKERMLTCFNLKFVVLNPKIIDAAYVAKLKANLNLISVNAVEIKYEHLQNCESPFIAKKIIEKINYYSNLRKTPIMLISPTLLKLTIEKPS